MLWCSICHRQHAKEDCPKNRQGSHLPLETPSHNGPYQGTIEVKVVAPGVSGEEEIISYANLVTQKGRERQRRTAIMVALVCEECGKAFVKKPGWSRRIARRCSTKCEAVARKRRDKARYYRET